MIAAGRLQALTESRASGTSIADLRVRMDRIINAMHSTVPEELWPEILRKIDGPVPADTPADEIEDCADARGPGRPRGIRSGRGELLDSVRTESLSTSPHDWRVLRRDPFPNRRSGRCSGCHRIGSTTTRNGPTRTDLNYVSTRGFPNRRRQMARRSLIVNHKAHQQVYRMAYRKPGSGSVRPCRIIGHVMVALRVAVAVEHPTATGHHGPPALCEPLGQRGVIDDGAGAGVLVEAVCSPRPLPVVVTSRPGVMRTITAVRREARGPHALRLNLRLSHPVSHSLSIIRLAMILLTLASPATFWWDSSMPSPVS